MTATIESPIGVAEFKEIYVRDASRAWCKLLWQENGWVIILSDYGHWAYWWGFRGEGVSVPKFLAKLECEYMGGKMMGSALYEYSVESTVQCIRETIREYRKTCGMTKEEARDEWELAAQLASGDMPFDVWYSESSIEDGYECHRKEVSSTWENFWKRLWVPLIQPLLKAECE